MRFRAWIWLLINMLTIILKSLIAPLAPDNMIYLYFLRVTAGAGHHQERAGVLERYANARQLEVFKKVFKVRLFSFNFDSHLPRLRTSHTSASTKSTPGAGGGRRSRRNSRQSSGFTQMDPGGWLDWFGLKERTDLVDSQNCRTFSIKCAGPRGYI